MSKTKKLDSHEAHRRAALHANFTWQDDYAEGHSDGCGEVTDTALIGTLPEEENGSPVFIVGVAGIATSTFGYSYSLEMKVSVRLRENGEPVTGEATDEEVEAAAAHTIQEYEQEYTELARLISVGAYQERLEDGSYAEDGIERRHEKLERWAIEHGWHFVKQADGRYALEDALPEMIAAYEAALESEEDQED
jgi:hypothetical protein